MSRSDRVWTVLKMLEWGTEYFKEKNIPDPRHSIEWLLAEVLELKRLDLYLNYDRPLGETELTSLRSLVKRRAKHEPLQYIIGHTDFMGCRIRVNPDVLIPRIETEQLVELVLERTEPLRGKQLSVLDIGTGSGCIPIALKSRNNEWKCAGLDLSENALKLAQENAALNDVDVSFHLGDLYDLNAQESVAESDWDIIISNPPYIRPEEKVEMADQVLNFEPEGALFVDDPLEVYRKIISFAAEKNSKLFLECNDKTASDIRDMTSETFSTVELLTDLDKNPRFVVAE